ncbi:hypothetical protein SAMN05892883_0420 [Jatrophihabitans sp. GAS493]|uniref:glycoside hydrolase family 16 protein n=1 Tax=Jatrophihabitans sp. GAS493 TaxID=1907575 RepID=UPI000BB6ACD3|nr:glycoside hydrolase family 16 protein [Jatrophihabitans sp. GAS493]SOD70778.1 hypothetical protein SAMN05892883_0420 [Jatrophihabitans sp. GAS493]
MHTTRHPLIAALLAGAASAAALIAVSSSPAAAASASVDLGTVNKCANPLLATDTTGWSSTDGTITRVAASGLSGASWAISTNGKKLVQPKLTVVAHESWQVSGWVRSIGTDITVRIGIDWFNAAGTVISNTFSAYVPVAASTATTGTWTKVSTVAVAPTGAVRGAVSQFATVPTGATATLLDTGCDYELASLGDVKIPKGNLPADDQGPNGWTQTLSEDFNTPEGSATKVGALPDGLWWGYPDNTKITNSTNGVYEPTQVVTVSGGLLHFNGHTEGSSAYAASELPLPKAGQTYGRWDVRYRYLPGSNIAGFKSVWMLWPSSDVWGDGEMDFAEFDNAADRSTVGAYSHRACGQTPPACPTDGAIAKIDPQQWHTATAIWSPGKYTAYTDGHLIVSATTQIATTPHHLVLQTEASDYGPTANPGDVFKVDVAWVVAYTRN